jgi:hypothetical protein
MPGANCPIVTDAPADETPHAITAPTDAQAATANRNALTDRP